MREVTLYFCCLRIKAEPKLHGALLYITGGQLMKDTYTHTVLLITDNP